MAYLDLKGEGDKSMPEKQRSCSGVGSDALRGPRDMAKLRREAPCCIPDRIGRDSEEGLWI
jgi:hypothetical protein